MPRKPRQQGRGSKKEERDPIADYKEWSDHRYDPGYFTGGRLPPGVRAMQKMLSTRDKRVLLFIIVGVLAVLFAGRIWAWFR
jgi:hypothetical protein